MKSILSHIRFVSLVCLAILLAGSGGFCVTKAGVTIETQAEMFYEGGIVTSELSATVVLQEHGITLEPGPSGGYDNAGNTHYFPHSITNIGNGSENLRVRIIYSTPETWAFSLIKDENGNCTHESGETATLESEIPISEDGKVCFFVAALAPTGETSGNDGYCTVTASIETYDGGYYYGANGMVYGGPDTAEATDILTIEGIFNLRINRDDDTGRFFITWDGGPADIYRIDGPYDDTFASASIEAYSVTSPYYCASLEVKDGKNRFFRVALAGSSSYAPETVGKYDVPVSVGFNQLSSPFLLNDTQVKYLVGSQVTGYTSAPKADKIKRYNPSVQGEYEIAWLVDGIGPPYDGQWYGVSAPSTMLVATDEGWTLEIVSPNPATYVSLIGEVSSVNRSVPVKVGLNYVGTCFPVKVALNSSNLWQSGMTGERNGAAADKVKKYNPLVQGEYEIAWLVDKVNPTVNGTWYSVSTPSTMELMPGRGYWLDIGIAHSAFTWTYLKPY